MAQSDPRYTELEQALHACFFLEDTVRAELIGKVTQISPEAIPGLLEYIRTNDIRAKEQFAQLREVQKLVGELSALVARAAKEIPAFIKSQVHEADQADAETLISSQDFS